jgi:hypothetical protein
VEHGVSLAYGINAKLESLSAVQSKSARRGPPLAAITPASMSAPALSPNLEDLAGDRPARPRTAASPDQGL